MILYYVLLEYFDDGVSLYEVWTTSGEKYAELHTMILLEYYDNYRLFNHSLYANRINMDIGPSGIIQLTKLDLTTGNSEGIFSEIQIDHTSLFNVSIIFNHP